MRFVYMKREWEYHLKNVKKMQNIFCQKQESFNNL
jgi:hypothetical protein